MLVGKPLDLAHLFRLSRKRSLDALLGWTQRNIGRLWSIFISPSILDDLFFLDDYYRGFATLIGLLLGLLRGEVLSVTIGHVDAMLVLMVSSFKRIIFGRRPGTIHHDFIILKLLISCWCSCLTPDKLQLLISLATILHLNTRFLRNIKCLTEDEL